MIDPLATLLGERSPQLEEVDLVPNIHDALARVKCPAVVQVVVLRDGLLIGTEVFVAGRYAVGSGAQCDLRLEDLSVGALHARLVFKGDAVGIVDEGGGLCVNGHPVRSAQLRPLDEIAVGAFSLKVRVLKQTVPEAEVTMPPVAVTPLRLRPVPQGPTEPGRSAVTEANPVPAELLDERPSLDSAPDEQRGSARGAWAAPGAAAGRDRLFLELYWGDRRQHARAFGESLAKKPLLGGLDDRAAMPLWGFELPAGPMVLADKRGAGYRVFVPPGAAVERRDADGNFQPLTAEQARSASFTLKRGDAVRFSRGQSALVAFVQPALPAPWTHPLANLPHLSIGLVALFLAFFAAFVSFAPSDDGPDFTPKEIPKLAVAFVRKDLQKKPDAQTRPEKASAHAQAKHPNKDRTHARPQRLPPVLASGGALLKVLEQGIPMPAIALAKRSGHGSTASILGSAPQASNGLAGLGLPESIRGIGSLRGTGIGELGAGHTGKRAIGGRVDHVVGHDVALTGRIDRDAVAKVIESHLGEVSACYERSLVLDKDAGGGKLTLQWNLSTAGAVTSAKSKSSSMKTSAVESCILSALKGWKFPPAMGAGVTITYPFLFHSVGF